MNFKRFYINGNEYTIHIFFGNKRIDFSFEEIWNRWMLYLTRLTSEEIVKPTEVKPPVASPIYPEPPRKFTCDTTHLIKHLTLQNDEQVLMTINYWNWIISTLKDPFDIAIYNMAINAANLRLERIFAGDLYYWFIHSYDLLEIRKNVRINKDFKTSDIIRNVLDIRLVFVFDAKDDNGDAIQELYWLYDSYFEKMDPLRFKTRRAYVEYQIKHENL